MTAQCSFRKIEIGVWLVCVVCLLWICPALAQEGNEIVTQIGADEVVDEMIIADPNETVITDSKAPVVIKSEQVSRINRSLKNIIEQNRTLSEERDRLDQELRRLRGERRFEKNKIKDAEAEKIQLLERVQELQKMDKQARKQLKDKFSDTEQSLKRQIVELRKKVREAHKPKEKSDPGARRPGARRPGGDPAVEEEIDPQDAGLGLITMLDELVEERQQADQDEARVHYNMGNVFFHRGEYEKAAEEYGQAVEIDPSNANAHFNLALVAGDYHKNYKQAIKHYSEYLYLNPNAEDRLLVKEKILEAKMEMRAQVSNMSIEKDLHDHAGFDYTW